MATVSLSIDADSLRRKLLEMGKRMGSGATVSVGFLEKSSYPAKKGRGKLPVATVAFWNEFGTSRMVPRPFFRRMIAAKSPEWGKALGVAAKATGYDGKKTMMLMGVGIQGQLVESINEFTTPALKPSTIARKGFSKALIDSRKMINSVDYEVDTK